MHQFDDRISLIACTFLFYCPCLQISVLDCLASVVHAVIQAIWRTELEDGTRTGVRLKRLHAYCGVCTSPTVMLNPLWGMAWL